MVTSSCKVIVVGASGFIGRNLTRYLHSNNFSITAVSREPIKVFPPSVEYVSVADFIADKYSLRNVDAVIFAAGIAHGGTRSESGSCREVNVNLALEVAQKCKSSEVSRFIYLSSIAVHGTSSDGRAPFNASDELAPVGEYAYSKAEAEDRLTRLLHNSSVGLVIIRPPLVFGPDAPGNFRHLRKLASLPIPLPFGGINNRRSYVSIWNLMELISICISHPNADGQVFLVKEDISPSTTQLLLDMRKTLQCSLWLFPVSPIFCRILASLFNLDAIYNKLYGSFEIDDAYTRKILNWTPNLSYEEGLRKSLLPHEGGFDD